MPWELAMARAAAENDQEQMHIMSELLFSETKNLQFLGVFFVGGLPLL